MTRIDYVDGKLDTYSTAGAPLSFDGSVLDNGLFLQIEWKAFGTGQMAIPLAYHRHRAITDRKIDCQHCGASDSLTAHPDDACPRCSYSPFEWQWVDT